MPFKVSILCIALLSAAARATEWRVDYDQSKLAFVATYEDIPFEGRFEHFDAMIRFDTDALKQSKFEVQIAIGSINSDSEDRDSGMKGAEWFDVRQYPKAIFITQSFSKAGPDNYVAIGDLSIKGVTRSIRLPFRWNSQGQQAELYAETKLRRTDFRIGTGDWEKDGTIGFDVKVIAQLHLTKIE